MQEIFSVVSSIVDRRLADQNSAITNIGSFVSKQTQHHPVEPVFSDGELGEDVVHPINIQHYTKVKSRGRKTNS
jgi:hypothetical protein